MTNGNAGTTASAEPLKSYLMAFITVVFVVLYVISVWGVVFTPNEAGIKVLQPIVYVIIGYYFGRIPGEQNEKKLEKQISDKTAEAKNAKDETTQARSAEARVQATMEAVKSTLKRPVTPVTEQTRRGFADVLGDSSTDVPADALRHSVADALSILERS